MELQKRKKKSLQWETSPRASLAGVADSGTRPLQRKAMPASLPLDQDPAQASAPPSRAASVCG